MMAHIEHSNLTSSIIEEARPPELSYPALFVRFLRFGVMAFGGPWRR